MGFNSTVKVTSKSVELPIQLGSLRYKVEVICVPKIGVNFKVPGINKIIKTLKKNDYKLAYKKLNGQSEEVVSNIKFILGAKDSHIVMKLRSGSVETAHKTTCYYESSEGLILIGSIKDWMHNAQFIDSGDFSSVVENVEIEYPDESEIGRDHSDSENEIFSLVLTNECEEDEELDMIDIASYTELDKKCDFVLQLEKDFKTSIEEEKDMEKEVTNFVLQNTHKNREGRWEMAIPWLSRYKGLLGRNDQLSLSVLKSVKKKYKGTDILNRVDKVIKDQQEIKIIERVDNWEDFKNGFPSYSFISHFPLIKENRITSKVRIVYMCNLAQKNKDGSLSMSINNCVHPGYNKNEKIQYAFAFTRFFKFVLGFDISKAFHNL